MYDPQHNAPLQLRTLAHLAKRRKSHVPSSHWHSQFQTNLVGGSLYSRELLGGRSTTAARTSRRKNSRDRRRASRGVAHGPKSQRAFAAPAWPRPSGLGPRQPTDDQWPALSSRGHQQPHV